MRDITHIVLVGGGHAHLEVVRRAGRLIRAGCRLTLIDPNDFHYSGMATGLLGGRYRLADLTVNLDRLSQRAGVTRVRDLVIDIDRTQRLLVLASGDSLHYDYVSLNIGSELNWPEARLPENTFALKPVAGLQLLRDAIERWQGRSAPKVVVVGAGVSGCEVAANLRQLLDRHAPGASLRLTTGGDGLAAQLPLPAQALLQRRLGERNISFSFRSEAVEVNENRIRLNNGEVLTADLVVLATGLRSPSLVRRLGLPASSHGLVVDQRLLSADSRIFAAGDCADINAAKLPNIGVYGVRAAATLIHNLIAVSTQTPMREYHPQAAFLSIINLGDGTALAWRGRRWYIGRMAMWLKETIDRRFLARYQA